MSMTDFFKDLRLQRVGRMSHQDAASLLADFDRQFDYEGCNADQLFALAGLSQRARNFVAARECLARAAALPEKAHVAFYKMGRLELAAGHPDVAAERFAWGAQLEPGFAHNWIGRARALVALGQRAAAVPFAERFVSFQENPHTPEDLAALSELADYLFEAGERQRSGPIYALVRSFGSGDQRSAVRQAESLIASGDTELALALLRPLQASGQLDLWGRRALAHCESQAGRHAEAVALAEDVLVQRPDDPGFVATYLDVVVRARDPVRWRDALDRLSDKLTPPARAELAARLCLAEGRIAEAGAALAGMDFQRQTRLFYTAIETGYAALGCDEVTLAEDLAARLALVAPDVAAPLLLRTDIHFRMQRWEQAAESLRAMPAQDAQQPHVLLKWFEYYCFIGDTGEAELLQAQLEDTGLPSRQFALPILRFLAERQKWTELTDRALAWLGADFSYGQIGYVLYRAAKRTGRQAAFLSAIEAIDGWRDQADLLRLHTALAWDRAGSLAEMDQASDAASRASPAMRRRMDVQRALAARANAPAGRRALFLCTNANYLCATIVALHSALQRSAAGREDCFLIVDDDLVARTEALAQPFRDLGFSVSVVAASDVVGNAEKLYAGYGLFTSGHVLASAAYYRIFFARHLYKLGIYARAIYIDSDVLVRVPLDGLFAADLDGHPLAARVETPRPEVTRAIALHRLRDDLYFNSGVLLFDLQNPQLPAALDGAVGAIADDHVTLLFHDQCALNLGFRERFLRLGMQWNTPVGEDMLAADLPPDAAILHYLDRPKPWSAAYDGDCALLWLEQWRMTAELIGEAQALEVFALSSD